MIINVISINAASTTYPWYLLQLHIIYYGIKTSICNYTLYVCWMRHFQLLVASGLPGWGRHSIDAVRMAGPCGMLRLPGAAPCCSSVLFVTCWVFRFFFKENKASFDDCRHDISKKSCSINRKWSWYLQGGHLKEMAFQGIESGEASGFQKQIVVITHDHWVSWMIHWLFPFFGGNETLWNDKHRRLGKLSFPNGHHESF